MKDWDEMPEAMGPQSEGVINNVQYGDPGYPSIGQAPRQLDWETVLKERDQAARAYELRQRVERAALAVSVSALEAAVLADKVMADAAGAGKKARP
jgi:hypothetical protein